VNIIDAVVGNHQVGFEIECMKLKVTEGFPGIVSWNACIDDFDPWVADVAKSFLKPCRECLSIIIDEFAIGRRASQDDDSKTALGFWKGDFPTTVSHRIVAGSLTLVSRL
jgi:hypothetical protein